MPHGKNPPPSAEAIRRAVGATIRIRRDSLEIPQERLAYDSDVDRSYLGQIERGLHTPTLETIHKLLPRLQMKFSEFALEYETILRREMKTLRKENKEGALDS